MDVKLLHQHKIKFPEVVIEDGRLVSVVVENPDMYICVTGDMNAKMADIVKKKMALCIVDILTVSNHMDDKSKR